MIEVTSLDFQVRVVDASLERPVLVDFWAPWCQPCLAAAPVLERLETEANGTWVLAKVNVDENPDLAQAFGIRSIPSLKLVYQGQLVGQLNGMLPEPQFREWMAQFLPEVPEEAEHGITLDTIRQAQANGQLDEAYRLALEFHGENPADPEGLALAAVLAAHHEPMVSKALLENIDAASPWSLHADAARFLMQMQQEAQRHDLLPDGPGKLPYKAALEAYCAHNYATALEKLVELVATDKTYHQEAPRRACLALFALLGPQHPLTGPWRKQFNRALY